MSKESSMARKGDKQGDMAPHVMDIQKKESSYPERFENMTTQYIERRDKHEAKSANSLRKEAYKGRYE